MTDSAGSIPLGPGPEFDRIRTVVASLGGTARGIGDDAAILPGGWCVSVDASVEGVHFRRDWLALEEIGWRAAAAALSDLAAMGAAAEAVLLAVGAPATFTEAELATLLAGAGAVTSSVGGSVVGGDLTRGAELVVSVTVLGRAPRPVSRRGALPGDRIWVTGALGGARAALEEWRAGRVPSPEARRRFAAPVPRIEVGGWLAEQGARAMLDLSDGLAGDVRHLAAASGARITIELDRLPIDLGVAEAASRAGQRSEPFAAAGGEDYELLVAMPPEFSRRDVPGDVALTEIGTVNEGRGAVLLLDGRPVDLAGFDHFA